MSGELAYDGDDEYKVTFKINYSIAEPNKFHASIYNIAEEWNVVKFEAYLLRDEEINQDETGLEALTEAIKTETFSRRPNFFSEMAELDEKLPSDLQAAGIVFAVRLEKLPCIYSAVLVDWGDILPTIEFFLGASYWFSLVQWTDDDGKTKISIFDDSAHTNWLRTSQDGKIPLVTLKDADGHPTGNAHTLTKEEATTVSIFAPFAIVRKTFEDPSSIGESWILNKFKDLENTGSKRMTITINPVASLIIAKMSNSLNFFIPNPRENITEANANLEIFLDPSADTLTRIGGLSGFLGHSIMTVLDFVPVAGGGVKASKKGIEKFTEHFAQAEAKIERSLALAKKTEKSLHLEQIIKQAEQDMAAMRKAKADLMKQLNEIEELKKLNPKEAAKKLRTALGTSGTKIWSGKVKANVANWQRLVKNESAIPVGNSGRRFRTNTIKDSLGDTEEMFEQEIKLSESMKKELRELQKNASSDIAGEALKEAIDETLKKKKVRLDHVWIDHFPDGGGKIILTDYTGSFQWAHFSKSKLYETILRSELEELIPQAKDKNFTIQMIEYYWRQ
ncbi:MAG TPA: hypothetical protein DCY48_00700 [Candidatus Magasanikbacteria bacterium]|nr:MAG: hypothetical protein A3I74_02280 [Candidatus Magasanikbacteria bacterium RIFCSPLOWO2_02_FULL_47_16]HAZ28279.1 hypothetical protein [Candidatus Magasanikbacteria bacterium]